MKILRYNLIALFLFIFLITPAYAHYPTVTIDSIGQVPVVPGDDTVVYVPGFPFMLIFEGTVTHEGHGNLAPVELSATINGEAIFSPASIGSAKDKTTTYQIPWIVHEPVYQYEITVTALHPEHLGGSGCKAAPAIAASYLKDQGVKAKDDNSNTIAAVAQETGKSGELSAKNKCAPDYTTQTITFVTEQMD